MSISKVTREDIPQIAALQEQLLITNTDTKDGFLVSAFSNEDYLHFLDKYEFFYKYVEGDELLGVVMAFHSCNVVPEDKNNSLLRNTVIGDCIIIKQIFTAPKSMGKGISTQLYSHLFSEIGSDLPIVCVIVIEPFNERSCNFHKKHGFIEYLNFTPDADKDKVIRKRSAWIRLHDKSSNIESTVRLSNIFYTGDDDGEVMASRADAFISLYLHEDNLNWTKFGVQTTILFALFASFAYFYEKPFSNNLLPIMLLGGWGLAINIIFWIKIKSGLHYMNTYKKKIQAFDRLLTFYYPKMMPIFASHEKISQTSITCRLLSKISLAGLLVWAIAVIVLLLKNGSTNIRPL